MNAVVVGICASVPNHRLRFYPWSCGSWCEGWWRSVKTCRST